MNMRNYEGSFTVPVVISLLLAIVAVCLIGWLLFGTALGADNAAPCLTKEQARTKWPQEWLYWHGVNHCWDNVRGRAATANMPNGEVKIIVAPKPNRAKRASREDALDANGNAVKRPSIFYPDLMPGPGVSGSMLRAEGMTWWPGLADFDEQPQFVPWQKRILFLTTQEKP
jgi:hypothetical protein